MNAGSREREIPLPLFNIEIRIAGSLPLCGIPSLKI